MNDSDSVHDHSSSSFLSPSLYSGTPSLHLASDSFLKDTFPRMSGYGRVRSQAFSVDSHPSSLPKPTFSNRKAFTKEKLSLPKSRDPIVPRFFPAFFLGPRFRRQLGQSASRQEEKTPRFWDFHFWEEKTFRAGNSLRFRLLLRHQIAQNRGG